MDGAGGDRLRREAARDLRQPQRSVVARDNRDRDGRGEAAAVRHAPDARSVPDPAQPAAALEVAQVVEEVPRLHRDMPAKGLHATVEHRATVEASVHQGPADRTAGPHTAPRPHRPSPQEHASRGTRGELRVRGERS